MPNSAILWAYSVDSQGQGQLLDELSNTLAQGQSYRWVHLVSDHADARAAVNELGLTEALNDALLATETRPRVLPINDGALIYLRGINKNPQADPHDMVALRVWVKGNTIITARRNGRALRSVEEVKQLIELGQAPASPVDLLLMIISNLADKIHETVVDINESLMDFESSDSIDKAHRDALARLRKQSAAIRRYLAPQRDALDAMLRLTTMLDKEHIFELREQADRILRDIEELDLARERAIVMQDEMRNRIADEQGMRMYVLSMVTAIFLPLSFLTGVFGMNVGGLPGTESGSAFSDLMLAMVGVAIVMLVLMRWKKWI